MMSIYLDKTADINTDICGTFARKLNAGREEPEAGRETHLNRAFI